MIALNHVRPQPLIPNGIDPNSEIWDCECTFEKGKKYLVRAPSGKGKSTFIHLIYGIRQDYEGTLHLEKQDIRQKSNEEWSAIRRDQFSIVFQDLRLFPQLSAFENIQLNAQLNPNTSDEQIREMAKTLGVSHLLDQKASTLSYGQQQRMAIIRALSQPFDFLLLDEPFSHLDEENTRLACQLIEKELQSQNAGLILVSLGETYGINYDHELIL